MFHKRHPPPGAPPGTLVVGAGAVPTRLLLSEYSASDVRERELTSPDELAAGPPVRGTQRVTGPGSQAAVRAGVEERAGHVAVDVLARGSKNFRQTVESRVRLYLSPASLTITVENCNSLR